MKILGMEMVDLSTSLPGIRNSQKRRCGMATETCLTKDMYLICKKTDGWLDACENPSLNATYNN